MNKIEQTFGRKKVLLPVVHVQDLQQAEEQTLCALEHGADGVFLINHAISVDELLPIYAAIVTMHSPLWSTRTKFKKFWLGMNMLGLSPREALERMPDNGGGLWTDNAGVVGRYSPEAQDFLDHRKNRSSWDGLYFGGVAFKYQEQPENLAYAVWVARTFMDVVTTSGDATGSAPSVGKIRAMHEVVGDHPLAIASGITIENVRTFLPYVDAFLVASGISRNFYEFDAPKVRELADVIHSYET